MRNPTKSWIGRGLFLGMLPERLPGGLLDGADFFLQINQQKKKKIDMGRKGTRKHNEPQGGEERGWVRDVCQIEKLFLVVLSIEGGE